MLVQYNHNLKTRTAIKSQTLTNKWASHDVEQIARSVLGFSKMITDPKPIFFSDELD